MPILSIDDIRSKPKPALALYRVECEDEKCGTLLQTAPHVAGSTLDISEMDRASRWARGHAELFHGHRVQIYMDTANIIVQTEIVVADEGVRA